MNYFSILNNCLLELNYKQLQSFDSFVKAEHQRLKILVNRINNEICSGDDWAFRNKTASFVLPANVSEFQCPVVATITSVHSNDDILEFVQSPDVLISGITNQKNYSMDGQKMIFKSANTDRVINFSYLTNNFAKNSQNVDIPELDSETDISIIPAPFCEPLLVYGTCLLFKANPTNPKYKHWYNMYLKTLSLLESAYIASSSDSPKIVIK